MALTGYERYQLEWMIDHGHSLAELMGGLTALQNELESTPGVNLSIDDAFGTWVDGQGFGSEIFASEAEWRDAEGKEPAAERGRIDLPAHGTASPESRDALIDIALNSRALDEALESGDTAYILDCATLAANAHIDIAKIAEEQGWKPELDRRMDKEFGTITKDMVRECIGSPSLPEHDRLQAVGVGNSFNLFVDATLDDMGIDLKETGTVVTVDGQDYPLMKGATYMDSRMVDSLLDLHGEKRIGDYEKPRQAVSLKDAASQVRRAFEALADRDGGSHDDHGRNQPEH